MRVLTAELARKPRLRELPVALDGSCGSLDDLRDLLNAQSSEVAQLDNLGLTRRQLRKLFERGVQGDNCPIDLGQEPSVYTFGRPGGGDQGDDSRKPEVVR